MKKKQIAGLLIAVGIVLLCLSVAIAVMDTGNRNVIGGADLSTFLFVFSHGSNGLYSGLANCGIVFVVVGILVFVVKRCC